MPLESSQNQPNQPANRVTVTCDLILTYVFNDFIYSTSFQLKFDLN